MNEEQLNKIINDSDQYEQEKEYSLIGMLGDFYSKKMLSIVILIWSMGIIFMAGAVYSAIQFFHTDNTKTEILYGVLFLTFIQWVGLLKIFAWQIISRNSIKREIKRLELRIAKLSLANEKS